MRFSNFTDLDWSGFLGRAAIVEDASLAESAVGERSVLITGAGGSIGSGLARAVLAGRPSRLVLLDVSESALYESFRSLSARADASPVEIVPVTGSVGDGRFVAHLLRQHWPEVIFHTAAYKHVPLMERNPFSAIANNSIGTYRLVVAAMEAGVSRLIAVSTDKAVSPLSVMGVSKRIAELAVLSHSANTAQMNVVRLCNVLGSSGSVAEIFREQAEEGLPLTVTHPDAKRYFVSPAEAESAILVAAAGSSWGRVLVPECGEEVRVIDLARYIAGADAAIKFTGLRPGDKLREELWAADEVLEAVLPSGMRVLQRPAPSATEVAIAVRGLESAVERFDHAGMMCAIAELVPSYRALAAAGLSVADIAETAGPSTRADALAQDNNFVDSVALVNSVAVK